MRKLKSPINKVVKGAWTWKFAELTARILKFLQLFWSKEMSKYWSKMNQKQQKIAFLLTSGIALAYLFMLITGTNSSYPKVKINRHPEMNKIYQKSDSLELLEKVYQTIKNP